MHPFGLQTAPLGAQTFLFHSDWSTATGTSSTALLDASKDRPWDAEKGDGNGGVAVTDTVSGLPDGITHALTISHIGDNDNPGVRLDRSLPPFTSGKRAYRVYFKNVLPDDHAIPTDRHPWQDAAGGSNTNWEFNLTVDGAGQYAPYFDLLGSCLECEGVQWHRWTIGGGVQGDASTVVPKDSVYRFEVLLTHHPRGDSVDIEIKMYNADGSVRVDSDEWKRVTDGEPSSVVSWYAFNAANKDNLQDLQIGTNGWGGGSTSTPYVTWHWAALAVCDDWCGPHGNGGIEGN